VVARQTAPGEATVVERPLEIPVGVLPATRTAETLERLRVVLPAARACADVLDAALTSPAPVRYPALVLLHLGLLERGVGGQGLRTTPSVGRLMEAVDGERAAARAGWGYGPVPEGVALGRVESVETPAEEPGEAISLEHRYVTEVGVLGLSLFESAARSVGVEAPATTGLLLLYGVLLGRRLQGQGRALEHLGLGDFLLREVRALLHDGWTSALWSRLLR
jgi:opine dehydrogenase